LVKRTKSGGNGTLTPHSNMRKERGSVWADSDSRVVPTSKEKERNYCKGKVGMSGVNEKTVPTEEKWGGVAFVAPWEQDIIVTIIWETGTSGP